MEFPDMGKHCSESSCNKLDFLPIKCDACSKIFCDEHYSYARHDCTKAYIKNNQVPVCPLCNKPIPVSAGEHPDVVVGAHIDNDCQSDPARSKRKVFTNRCSLKGCKVKEVIKVVCGECGMNFCLRHRHVQDHQCQGKKGRALAAALKRQGNSNQIQGTMSDDEALAKALALSMQDSSMSQEELDLAYARQLQASEYHRTAGASGTNNNKDRCIVI